MSLPPVGAAGAGDDDDEEEEAVGNGWEDPSPPLNACDNNDTGLSGAGTDGDDSGAADGGAMDAARICWVKKETGVVGVVGAVGRGAGVNVGETGAGGDVPGLGGVEPL